MERAALWAGPEPDAEVFDLLVAASAAAASLAGREEPVDDDKFLAIPVGLVSKLSADFTPCGVRNMECELMVPHHIFRRQVLHADDVIAPHKLCCHLMDSIIPLVGNMLVQLRNLNASLLTVAAPL